MRKLSASREFARGFDTFDQLRYDLNSTRTTAYYRNVLSMPVDALIPVSGVDESPFVLVNGLNLWPWMFSI